MSAGQRRAVNVTVPLMAERGAAVTIGRIAPAALSARFRRPDANGEPARLTLPIEPFPHGAFEHAKPPARSQGGA